MTEECIHGLEAGLCDICYPKQKAEPPRAAPRTRPRESRPPAGPRVSRPSSTAPAGVAKPIDIGRQRLFHLTHIDNLESILIEGRLIAPAEPTIDISAPDTREARRAALIGDIPVADHVPFFLVPEATVWSDLRARSIDPRLAGNARSHELAEFVLLVTTIGDLDGAVVISDGDAADARTRFARDADETQRMLRRLLPDEDAVAGAEALVPAAVPFERISLVGVAHDRARDAVRQVLRQSAFAPRVAVHPPWFARPE